MKKPKPLSEPQVHQLKIAKATLRMPDAVVGVMECGSPGANNVTTKAGARLFLFEVAGWSRARIAKWEE